MTADVRAAVAAANLQQRIGAANDAANLVRFLLSDNGGWINRQVLHSDGGLR